MSASIAAAPVKSSTERQLELTLNAIARSMRKAIRLAEKGDPTGTSGGLWKAVEHRAGMLETMLKAAAEYAQALAAMAVQPMQPVPPPVNEAPAQPQPGVATHAAPAAPATAGLAAAAMAAEARAAASTSAAGAPKPAANFTPQPGAGMEQQQRRPDAVYMQTQEGWAWSDGHAG